MSAINLTKGGFLRRVMDYENNPTGEWKFLGDKPALIDFYASWCGPCRLLLPTIEELAKEYEGEVDIYKVNVEDEEELARFFGVRSVPTLIFIPMGENPMFQQGALPKPKLKEMIDKLLLKKQCLTLKLKKIMKKYECSVCHWVYDPQVGDPDNGIAPGTPFEDVPEDWTCPLCGVSKEDFDVVEE